MPSKKLKLSVYLSDDEYEKISAKARQAGLSFSSYAKAVCLGWEIKSLVDDKAIVEMVRTKADMGRLGGLLKLWLTKPDMHTIEVRKLLRELEARQREMRDIVLKLDKRYGK